MVNAFNIDRVIEAIRKEDNTKFDMRSWTCQTTACIGGFCNIIESSDLKLDVTKFSIRNARYFLGITLEQGQALFYLSDSRLFDLENNLTKEMAIAVLLHLKKTGEVDWDRFAHLSRKR